MKTHKDLDVWKKAMGLARLVYDETRKFPASEAYGLTSQMRRAAVSVPKLTLGLIRHLEARKVESNG